MTRPILAPSSESNATSSERGERPSLAKELGDQISGKCRDVTMRLGFCLGETCCSWCLLGMFIIEVANLSWHFRYDRVSDGPSSISLFQMDFSGHLRRRNRVSFDRYGLPKPLRREAKLHLRNQDYQSKLELQIFATSDCRSFADPINNEGKEGTSRALLGSQNEGLLFFPRWRTLKVSYWQIFV